ncbi:MAG TPA: histidine kinase [Thermoanaerobaculia bacterium]|nr:histidine kinase [Thermoanaerobaculia bacterium]
MPVLALVALLGITQVRRERREAKQTALQMARATAARLKAMHDESVALLARMVARPGVRALDPAACREELAVVELLPRYADLAVYDASGRLVCTGNGRESAAGQWIEGELRAGRLAFGAVAVHPVRDQTMMATATRIEPNVGTIVLFELTDVLGNAAFIPDAVILILDRNGSVVARSAAAQGINDVPRQYASVRLPELGWTIYGGVPSADFAEPVREMLVNGVIGVIGTALVVTAMTILLARRIGRPIHALADAVTAAGEGAYTRVGRVAGPQEISALADAFNQMIERREQADGRLMALSERLLTVQEEERARIARELHDDLGQSLTALKMDVVGLLQATEQPPSFAPIRDRILRTLDSTVTSVQRISSELRPSVLDDLGLVAAIDAEARLFEERSGIECELSVTGDVPVDADGATAIYRIVQEALTNVARHSNATRTELRLRNRGDELLLEIRDDGRGVTIEEIGDPLSFGLIGIRERAAVIGGTVQIEGVGGRGTIVSVRIPLTAKARLA